MEITNSKKEDIPEIFRLYELASDFQRTKFPENQWPRFDEELVSREVAENRQFKLLIDNKIACIWAITNSDPEIWEDDDKDPSIYIHRIATNPDFRGNNFIKIIVDWAIKFAKDQNKEFIRMDTCGINERLINHYTTCGFTFLGTKRLKDTDGLPSHYQKAVVCFFEIKVE